MSTNTVKTLAEHLVANHLHKTLRHPHADSEVRDLAIGSQVATGPADPDRRVVVVVGAGPSHVFHGALLAADAQRAIIEELGLDKRKTRRFLHNQLRHLRSASSLDPNVFETNLLACSILDYGGVYSALEKCYNLPYEPSYVYEVLAHLLKHRFVSAIINFNFDELLDAAISVELTEGDYHHIVSDGDCPDRPQEGYDRPIYVKPHGTISHLSTLRFTREAYLKLPPKIHKLVGDLVSGNNVTLWVIGFGMQSYEFNEILEKEGSGHGRHVFYMDDRHEHKLLTNTTTDAMLVNDKKSFQNTMERIWQNVDELFDANFRPRSIGRHQFLCEAFPSTTRKDPSLLDADEVIDHRVDAELALVVAKSRGFVNLKDIATGRPGTLMRQLRTRDRSIIERCEEIGLRPATYSSYAMTLARDDNEVKEGDFKVQPVVLADRLIEWLKTKFPAIHARRARELLVTIAEGQETEIASSVGVETSVAFRDPIVIRSQTEFRAWTHHLLSNSTWNTVLAVSEGGEWLEHDRVRTHFERKGARLGLIVGDKTWEAKTAKHFGAANVRHLNWWSHNHHMTIFLKVDTKMQRVECEAALFFVRRLRGERIAPLLLRHPKDTLAALNIFAAYWHKACPDSNDRVYVNSEVLTAAQLAVSTDFFSGADNCWLPDTH